MTAVVTAVLPGESAASDFTAAVREGTERRLAELLGPLDFSVIAVAA